MNQLTAVILAGGKSTRIKSKIPKVMHMLAGRPLISYPIEAARAIKASPVLVVMGPNQPELQEVVEGYRAQVVWQREPKGTGHAVFQAQRALAKFNGYVLVLCGDVPLIRVETLKGFIRQVKEEEAICGVLTMDLKDPGSYGRILRDLDGHFMGIVEAKDAKDKELLTREVNSGIFCVEKKWLFETLKKIEPKNSQKEYYLTDIVVHAFLEGKKAIAVKADEAKELLGVNTRMELAVLTGAMRNRINAGHMENGVSIIDPQQTYIDAGVTIGADTVIWPGAFLLGKTVVGNGCVIENGAVLKDARLAGHVHVKSYSVIEDSIVDSHAVVGPFARLRPGSKLGREVRVGNFVEVKKSELQDGVKANHLTYLGDALIGPKVNVGCGTITCNYDGKNKYQTVIGAGVFIGSDTQFVAPVKIGKGATIGAGSTITKDVPAQSLALSRTQQVVIKDWRPKWEKTARKAGKARKS